MRPPISWMSTKLTARLGRTHQCHTAAGQHLFRELVVVPSERDIVGVGVKTSCQSCSAFWLLVQKYFWLIVDLIQEGQAFARGNPYILRAAEPAHLAVAA